MKSSAEITDGLENVYYLDTAIRAYQIKRDEFALDLDQIKFEVNESSQIEEKYYLHLESIKQLLEHLDESSLRMRFYFTELGMID